MKTDELRKLALRHGTPLFVYDGRKISANFRKLVHHVKRVCERSKILYAVKANPNRQVLLKMCKLGCGADVMSGGELDLALRAGFKPEDILFNTPSKNENDVKRCIDLGITIVANSESDLKKISLAAETCEERANIGIRVNPDVEVEGGTVTMAGRSSQFGIPISRAKKAFLFANSSKNVFLSGMHCHAASNIMVPEPLIRIAEKILAFNDELSSVGVRIEFVDFGGGFGIPYRLGEREFDLERYAKGMREVLNSHERVSQCYWEPGRVLVGDAGYLLLEVVDIVESWDKIYAITDGGINCLARPALLEAQHRIEKIENGAEKREYVVTGPSCTTIDVLGTIRSNLKIGDLLVVHNCGAYGLSQSLVHFGSQPVAKEVFVD